MQMIDVLKRLAELDAQNPNIIKENTQIDECGMTPEMGMTAEPAHPAQPASINITAGSGDELANMLSTIMQLAGVKQVGDHDMGVEPAQSTLTAEPMTVGEPQSAGDSMRSVIDKMHGDDDSEEDGEEQETDEDAMSEYDNSPNDPNELTQDPNNTQHGGVTHQSGNPGAADGRNSMNNPKAFPTAESLTQQLFAEYESFLKESE